jgi:hypothetical protein
LLDFNAMADVLRLSLRPSERHWQGLTLARESLLVSQINNQRELDNFSLVFRLVAKAPA